MALPQTTGQDKKIQDLLHETGVIPRHIAIIMDGKGRWATKRGLPRIAGHNEGVNSVRDIVEACGQIGQYSLMRIKLIEFRDPTQRKTHHVSQYPHPPRNQPWQYRY